MELLKWLSITDRHTKMHLDRQLSPFELNSSQYMYVLRICKEPGITQDQFFNSFYIHPSNITRSIAYLEKAGFLRKELHLKDKRTCCLYPTEKALTINKHILTLLNDWHEVLLQDFSDEDRQLFSNFLQRAGKNALYALTQETENH